MAEKTYKVDCRIHEESLKGELNMHYLCQSCKQSFPREQLFTIHKQVAGETLPMKVCSDCRDKHEAELEKTRQNFQAQFGEKPAVLKIDDGGKATITPIVDIHKIIDDAMEKKIVVKVQDWEDVREYNPLAIANTKLTSLVCDEEIADKLARLEAQSQVNSDLALERILNGGA